jgi:diaminopimelate decarboxylase
VVKKALFIFLHPPVHPHLQANNYMAYFTYHHGVLYAEYVPLTTIATQFGTPTYVYSKGAFKKHLEQYTKACQNQDALVCYAVKANSNIAILNLLAKEGAGFDLVSGGELKRVLAAKGDPKKCIFSGVGKTKEEMRLALTHNILCFNVESIPELYVLNQVAQEMGKIAPISLRVNPDINANTHPYISTGLKDNKFGIAYHDATNAYRLASTLPHLSIQGIDCHIGSQLLDESPLLEALDKLLYLMEILAKEGIYLHHLDIGGGIGITYDQEQPISIQYYLAQLFERIHQWRAVHYKERKLKILLEPGRSIAGNSGILLTQTLFIKPGEEKNFAIVDAAMNDLMRPAMYEAWHQVLPVTPRTGTPKIYDIVGPVCESGDWLARQRSLALQPDDLLAILSAGAYGMTMASNYNTRGRAAEVMVDGDQLYCIRQREAPEQLFALESILPN